MARLKLIPNEIKSLFEAQAGASEFLSGRALERFRLTKIPSDIMAEDALKDLHTERIYDAERQKNNAQYISKEHTIISPLEKFLTKYASKYLLYP